MALKTIKQKADENPGFTIPKLRFCIQNGDENGMNDAGVVVRIGGRIYIDDDGWDRWIESCKRNAA